MLKENSVMRGQIGSEDLALVLAFPGVPHSVPLSSNSQSQEPLRPLGELPCPTIDLLSWNRCHMGE